MLTPPRSQPQRKPLPLRRRRRLILPAASAQTATYRHTFVRRGRHELVAVRVATRFPFGLFRKSRDVELTTEVLVYPALVFLKLYVAKRYFLNGWAGYFAARTQAFYAFLKYAKVLEAEWGADVDSFRPDVTGPLPFTRDPARVLCVFAGAFRSWHGVAQMAASLARLHRQGEDRLGAVFIGDGPERAAAEQLTRDVPGVTFTGAVPHDQLPQCLAAADIGVAPFDPGKHKPLALGFYWSPLKIFEYMSAGLPVVAPRLSRIAALVSDGDEGLLYDPADPRTLDDALVRLTDTELRERLGGAARVRAVAQYSWRAHCALLDTRLRALVAARSGTRT